MIRIDRGVDHGRCRCATCTSTRNVTGARVVLHVARLAAERESSRIRRPPRVRSPSRRPPLSSETKTWALDGGRRRAHPGTSPAGRAPAREGLRLFFALSVITWCASVALAKTRFELWQPRSRRARRERRSSRRSFAGAHVDCEQLARVHVRESTACFVLRVEARVVEANCGRPERVAPLGDRLQREARGPTRRPRRRRRAERLRRRLRRGAVPFIRAV